RRGAEADRPVTGLPRTRPENRKERATDWPEACTCQPAMRAASSFLAVVSTLACGTQFPEPNITSHATDDYVEVPYFPPAALAEVAGAPPIDACVWFGGHWVWRGDK